MTKRANYLTLVFVWYIGQNCVFPLLLSVVWALLKNVIWLNGQYFKNKMFLFKTCQKLLIFSFPLSHRYLWSHTCDTIPWKYIGPNWRYKSAIFSTKLINHKAFTLREELCLWSDKVFFKKRILCAKACSHFVDEEDIRFLLCQVQVHGMLCLSWSGRCFLLPSCIMTKPLCILIPPLLKRSTFASSLTTVERKCVDLEKICTPQSHL